jgi:PAS domain S-box-containing protein
MMTTSSGRMATSFSEGRLSGNSELVEANRRLTLLTRLANSFIPANSLPETCKSALDAISGEIGAKIYLNYEIDEGSEDLTLNLFGGLEQEDASDFRRVKIGKSLCGQVAETRDTVVSFDIKRRADELTAPLRRRGVTAYIGSPLWAEDKLIGTVAFATIADTGFASSDVDLVNMFARQLSALLDRGRGIQALTEKESRYRTALSAGRVGTWETDYQRGIRLWSEEGMALFGLSLPGCRGRVGGEDDEYARALHPGDRHLARHYHELADIQDTFPAEYRIIRPDGSMLWLSGHGQVVARGLDGRAHRLVSVMVDITQRKAHEKHIKSLLREVSHRSKNLLSVIQAITRQTVRTAGTMEEFARRFMPRLQGLATSHDILIEQGWQGAPLAALVRVHLAPFIDDEALRLEVAGPEIMLSARAAQAIGLALHELAANAAKHGSLSNRVGRVVIKWEIHSNQDQTAWLRLTWSEQGGPPVKNPSIKGFGHVVIERIVADSLDGEVSISYPPEGLTWTISAAVASVVSGDPSDGAGAKDDVFFGS